MKPILVTGAAGFIGAAVVARLLDRGDPVIGLDNHNSYYDPQLKEARIAPLCRHPNYTHIRMDLTDRDRIYSLFETYHPECVIHLAAQAGVRYSIENPLVYIDSNIVGFAHVLEGCRQHHIQHLVYASSSSVYGANETMPFSVHDNVDHPLSFYAATKKANELMAHSYSHLYHIPTTGLRFFTVYGPFGRPDMSPFTFVKAILEDKPLKVFNYGNHRRDFTYIDDIVEGILRIVDRPAAPNKNWSGKHPDPASSTAPYRIYNIGNSTPVSLMDFIGAFEKALGKAAHKEMLPLQPGDMPDTYADVSDLRKEFAYQPSTPVTEGVAHFVKWYRDFYKV